MKSTGLGDDIAKFTKATGIKKMVDTMSKGLNIPCGCEARKGALNKLFPYKKPPYKMDNTPIYHVDMEDNVMGKANNNGTIIINKNVCPSKIQDVIDHEMIHIHQMKRGDLD